MTTRRDVIELVRKADPLDQGELERWLQNRRSPDFPSFVEPDAEPRHHRHRGRAFIAGVVLVAGTAGTAAAVSLLGQPAPPRVQQHLAGLDAGMPADLRYNADVESAVAVAATAHGALYLAHLTDGGYCLEIVSDGDRPRGASCLHADDVARRHIEVIAPIPANSNAPLLVGGRVTKDAIVAIRVEYGDGAAEPVALGMERAWLLEVPDAQRESALARGITIVGVDGRGGEAETVAVPPLRDDDPLGTAHDKDQPIVLTTVSDERDFTLVLRLTGRVDAAEVDHLTLRFPDASTADVPLQADGTFSFDLPAERQDDFAASPGVLLALRDARIVASTPIGSVTYWRRSNG